MLSVCCLSFAMSIWSIVQCFTISSAASFGMMPRRLWTRASAASMSRYFCVRFSSDHTVRMAWALKMSPKMVESMIVDGMVETLDVELDQGGSRGFGITARDQVALRDFVGNTGRSKPRGECVPQIMHANVGPLGCATNSPQQQRDLRRLRLFFDRT